jgi:hypothetical protein
LCEIQIEIGPLGLNSTNQQLAAAEGFGTSQSKKQCLLEELNVGDLQPAMKIEAGEVAFVGIAGFGDMVELVVFHQDVAWSEAVSLSLFLQPHLSCFFSYQGIGWSVLWFGIFSFNGIQLRFHNIPADASLAVVIHLTGYHSVCAQTE